MIKVIVFYAGCSGVTLVFFAWSSIVSSLLFMPDAILVDRELSYVDCSMQQTCHGVYNFGAAETFQFYFSKKIQFQFSTIVDGNH